MSSTEKVMGHLNSPPFKSKRKWRHYFKVIPGLKKKGYTIKHTRFKSDYKIDTLITTAQALDE